MGLPGADAAALASGTMDRLLDVDVPLRIPFGKTQLRKPTTGSLVGLSRGVGEPVEVLLQFSDGARRSRGSRWQL